MSATGSAANSTHTEYSRSTIHPSDDQCQRYIASTGPCLFRTEVLSNTSEIWIDAKICGNSNTVLDLQRSIPWSSRSGI